MVLFHASLIRNSPCYHFPLKAPVCLVYWLILGKLWLGFAYVRFSSAAARRELIISTETLAENFAKTCLILNS